MNITDATLNGPSREDECGAVRIQREMRELAIEILCRPSCRHELIVVYLLSLMDAAIEANLLEDFSGYAERFADFLARGEDDVNWPRELENSEARG